MLFIHAWYSRKLRTEMLFIHTWHSRKLHTAISKTIPGPDTYLALFTKLDRITYSSHLPYVTPPTRVTICVIYIYCTVTEAVMPSARAGDRAQLVAVRGRIHLCCFAHKTNDEVPAYDVQLLKLGSGQNQSFTDPLGHSAFCALSLASCLLPTEAST